MENSRYGLRSSGIQHGDVFTSPYVVAYMLDMLHYTSDRDLSEISILEPSCGEGEFLMEIAARLKASSVKFEFDFQTAFQNNVYAYDIDSNKIRYCHKRLSDWGISFDICENVIAADFLLSDIPEFDCVVGNPPYVRYEQIPENQLNIYKNIFRTFHYRADIYILFFEKTLKALKPNGKQCFICSNRWLKNEYGKKLRAMISSMFCIESIISLEKASDAFQENVLAYPAITLIKNSQKCDFVAYSEIKSVQNLGKIVSTMLEPPVSYDWSNIFCKVTNKAGMKTIEEMGFKIGIGVATGADSIFISNRFIGKIEDELLLPALNAKDITGNKVNWTGKYILNPYKTNGNLIDLEDYPMAASYLHANKERLSKRHVAKKSPDKWYKTIDRIVPTLKSMPKILLPDISGNKYIYVDKGDYYPLHNLYYVTGGTLYQLEILAALLMTDYVRNQLYSITNCMNGGYPRWQSQYLRKLLIPDIKALNAMQIQSLSEAYRHCDIQSLNSIMDAIISALPLPDIKREPRVEQLSFEFSA
ncbi:MAG: Eco57I restriction-modification methylase domain-containing protein [Candidatus Cryptobacteroides sp.]